MKTNIMVGRDFAKSLALITSPGIYSVKASNFNRIHDENLGKDKYIVNLRAIIGQENADLVKAAFGTAKEIDLGDLNGLTASANIIINEGQDPATPMKGQLVKIAVDWVENKAGKKILAATSISVPPVIKANTFSFDDEVEETDQSLSATQEKSEVSVAKKEGVKAF